MWLDIYSCLLFPNFNSQICHWERVKVFSHQLPKEPWIPENSSSITRRENSYAGILKPVSTGFENVKENPGVKNALSFVLISVPVCWVAGADPGFFLGGGALVSCSTSTPINHIVFFFLQNTSCIRKPQVISGGRGGVRTPCTLPLDPPLSSFHCCSVIKL